MNYSLLALAICSTIATAEPQYSAYVAVDPCRIVDTREAGGVIAAGDFRNFQTSGTLTYQGGTECLNPMPGVQPTAVSAYVVAVPIMVSTAGVLTAYPADQLPPPVGTGSTVNFSSGEVTGNTTNITLSDGEFAVLSRNTAQHVVIDVQGYFYPMTAGSQDAQTERYVDNGDGTISDHQTGLMWEKKLADDDPACINAHLSDRNVHCAINAYTATGKDIYDNPVGEGSLYTEFLATLNLDIIEDTSSTCFANYCDWRVPKLSELNSIVIENCDPNSCIDQIFGPTTAYPPMGIDGSEVVDPSYYWTETHSSTDIWEWYQIDFYYGDIHKWAVWSTFQSIGYVRAVRREK